MATLPAAHATENQKLLADAYVDLFEIALRPSGLLAMKDGDALTWQGRPYDSLPVRLEGVERSAGERRGRPTLTVGDLNAVFGPYVAQRAFDKAVVTRKRVLRQHLTANAAIWQARVWWAARVASYVPDVQLTLELRDLTDGPNFVVPARAYVPPQFPAVMLS